MTDKNAWIGQKILAREDDLQQLLDQHRDNPARETTAPDPELVPVDPVAEQAAYAELLAILAGSDEPDSEFTALSAEEFAEDSFTPPTLDTQESI